MQADIPQQLEKHCEISKIETFGCEMVRVKYAGNTDLPICDRNFYQDKKMQTEELVNFFVHFTQNNTG